MATDRDNLNLDAAQKSSRIVSADEKLRQQKYHQATRVSHEQVALRCVTELKLRKIFGRMDQIMILEDARLNS